MEKRLQIYNDVIKLCVARFAVYVQIEINYFFIIFIKKMSFNIIKA